MKGKKNGIILYLINPEEYLKGIIKMMKKTGGNFIYVTATKPCKSIITSLEKNGIDKDRVMFIDCISKSVDEKAVACPNCILLDSPQNLPEIGIAVNVGIKSTEGKATLLLDSISTLLLYNDANTVGRFSNFLINRMKLLNVNSAMLALETDTDKEVIQQIKSVCDEVKSI